MVVTLSGTTVNIAVKGLHKCQVPLHRQETHAEMEDVAACMQV